VDARERTAGEALLAWLNPLHSGEAFGEAGRALTCVAGLLSLALGITGWQRWADKRRAQSATRGGRRQPAPPLPTPR
jgi:uncharacterized iron-regulated membrane protein